MNPYLKENTLVREELINYKLIYELKKAAALKDYHLKVHMPSVDIDGYDMIIDDGSLIRKAQIKSTLDSKTRVWDIHKKMILPSYHSFEDYGFGNLFRSTDSCIILIKAQWIDDDLKISYYYTDIDVLCLMGLGILVTTKGNSEKVSQILNPLRKSFNHSGKVRLSKSMFIKLNDAEAFLTMAGFHSRHQEHLHNNIWQAIKCRYKPAPHLNGIKGMGIEMTGHVSRIAAKFKELLSPDFKYEIKTPKDIFPHWFED